MWWMSLARPKSAIFITLSSVTKTLRAARSLWMHWTNRNRQLEPKSSQTKKKKKKKCLSRHRTVVIGYLFGGQVLHASGHLESAGHQVFDGHVLHGDLVRVVAVLHPRWAPSSQVLPQVTLGGVLNDHIQRTWGGTRRRTDEGPGPQ